MTLPHFYYEFYILDNIYRVWYYIIKERGNKNELGII